MRIRPLDHGNDRAVARYRGLTRLIWSDPGVPRRSAPLHPRLYAVVRSAD